MICERVACLRGRETKIREARRGETKARSFRWAKKGGQRGGEGACGRTGCDEWRKTLSCFAGKKGGLEMRRTKKCSCVVRRGQEANLSCHLCLQRPAGPCLRKEGSNSARRRSRSFTGPCIVRYAVKYFFFGKKEWEGQKLYE